MVLKRLFLLLFVMQFVTLSCLAQPGNPPIPTPITGIEWLLLGGAALGARKVYQNLKNNKPGS